MLARPKMLLFVGERRSPTAIKMNATWDSGRLCALTLHRALQAAGVPLERCRFVNLWADSGELRVARVGQEVRLLQPRARGSISLTGGPKPCRYAVVALGKRVQAQLVAHGVAHVAMIHPAARGRIRKIEAYQAHVATVLAGL